MPKTYTMSPAALAARKAAAQAGARLRGVPGRRWLSIRLAEDTVATIDKRRGKLSRDRYVASRV